MYRIAVIQNESELLRSGYANVSPKLKSIDRLSQYNIESFTVVNIASLFRDGNSSLHTFDSLFISTNATSDRAVLDILRQNSKRIADFLDMGKGVFISSQKKLSTTDASGEGNAGTTRFLPDYYEFHTIERPKSETDSGVGSISVPTDSEHHPLIEYPSVVTAQMVSRKCEKNEFRRHYYRSCLLPKTKGAYISLMRDDSYEQISSRPLLMVGQSPHNNERVVISTIAVDWEFHRELLTNIIVFITEGLPKVAFIQKKDSHNSDYDFLFTNATLSKIPHSVYHDSSAISRALLKIHDTYIFSPGWTSNDITKFLNDVDANRPKDVLPVHQYRRVYYFQSLDGSLTLTQYSNFSSIDLMIDRAAVWLASRFERRMWGDSFWITHDVILMMRANRLNLAPYVVPVLCHVKEHFRHGSYDGVMGATCGLLKLLDLFESADSSLYCQSGFTKTSVTDVCAWISENISSQSSNDKQTAYLTLRQVKRPAFAEDKMQELAEDIYHDIKLSDLSEDDATELDVCRYIAICLECDSSNLKLIRGMLANLRKRQSPEGGWSNIGRTAHVLVFLLEHLKQLPAGKDLHSDGPKCEDMIYKGILFLRANYNWNTGNWDGDLQATAKAAHAIGLYNQLFKYTTQEFLNTIERESARMQSGELIKELSGRINHLIVEANKSSTTIAKLQKANVLGISASKREYIWMVIAICSAMTLVSFILYLFVEDTNRLVEALRSIAPTSVIAGVVISVVFTLILDRVKKKTEQEKNNEDTK